MTLPLRTMHDRVLVRRVRHAVSDGGIIIPEGHGPAQEWHGSQTVRGEFTVEGEVIAVGPGPECVERREIAGVEFLRADLLATGAAPESPEPVRLNRLMTALRRVARPPPTSHRAIGSSSRRGRGSGRCASTARI